MKQYWHKLSAHIDSRTLRERALMFITAAVVIIFLVFFLFLNPSNARQKLMLAEIANQQGRIAAVEMEVVQTLEAHTRDPDAAERARLADILANGQTLKGALTAMQQGMVPAERMTALLEQILRSHRGLRLKSMRTLNDAPADAVLVTPIAPAAAGPSTLPVQLLHKHGVELVLQGSFHDMVAYMGALEKMQGQIFWGNANMAVDTYPAATLTLTVYTINLDKKWLKL